MKYLQLLIMGLVLLVVVACEQQPTDERIRAIVQSELATAVADVKQGPPGEQGPLPSDEILKGLIDEIIPKWRDDLQGPQGLQGEKGEQGKRGPQGLHGTAQLSLSDRATLNKVNNLERTLYGSSGISPLRSSITGLSNDILQLKDDLEVIKNVTQGDLANLRREIQCEISGPPSYSGYCNSSLHGLSGSSVSGRIDSLNLAIRTLESSVANLESNVAILDSNIGILDSDIEALNSDINYLSLFSHSHR